jgi:hypothetical protein
MLGQIVILVLSDASLHPKKVNDEGLQYVKKLFINEPTFDLNKLHFEGSSTCWNKIVMKKKNVHWKVVASWKKTNSLGNPTSPNLLKVTPNYIMG